MKDPSETIRPQSSKQELLDEIENLRKQLDAAKHRQNLHDILSRSINIGYWEWDEITKRPAYFSKEMAAIVGMSLETLYRTYQCEEDFFPFIHSDDREHYIDNLNVILDPEHPRGLAHTFDYRIVRPNGEVRYVRELEYGTLEENGVVIRTYGAIQDITDHQESILALKYSEQRYSSLFSILPLGVMEQDWSRIKSKIDELQSEGIEDLSEYFENNPGLLRELVSTAKVTNVNDSLLQIYQADSLDEFIDTEEDISSWWSPEWANLYKSEIVSLAGPDGIVYSEIADTRMDDSPFEIRFISNIVKGYEDSWKRVLTIVEDVSERKQYEIDLIEAKSVADNANQAKSEFLANMSHELRTPMHSVLSFSRLGLNKLAKPSIDTQKLVNYFERIEANGSRLLTLLNDLLDISKLETGKMIIEFARHDLREILNASVNSIEVVLEENNQRIEINDAGADWSVHVDRAKMIQVIINLLSNAAKFSPPGTSITITFGDSKIKLGRRSGDNITVPAVTLSVVDQGVGIPQDELESVFDKFIQSSKTRSGGGGTGLGLAISKEIVEAHNGRIIAKNIKTGGAEFIVTIPRQPYTLEPEST